jgi:hypothetical protein
VALIGQLSPQIKQPRVMRGFFIVFLNAPSDHRYPPKLLE